MRKRFPWMAGLFGLLIVASCAQPGLVLDGGTQFIPHVGGGEVVAQERSMTTGFGSSVLLQGFHWGSHSVPNWYGVISGQAANIRNRFAYVWFPPVSQSAGGGPQGYLPTQWYNLNSAYGTQAALTAAIAAIRPARAIADIVVNHRNGTTRWADFTNPAFADNRRAITQGDEAWTSSGSELFGQPISVRGAADTGGDFHAGRDLDHTNASVQNEVIAWMRWLRNTIGFAGWRWDFVRGFHGWHVGNYNVATTPEISIGELWTDGVPQTGLDEWVRQTESRGAGGRSLVFDFTLKGRLNQAFGWFKDAVTNGVAERDFSQYNVYPNLSVLRSSHGTSTGYIGWRPQNAVTFVDNHDTGSTQQHWELRGSKVPLAYVYILTHPGLPMVAWDHYFDSGTALRNLINNLIDIRRTRNITTTSTLNILLANNNEYVARVGDSITVRIGPGATFNPGSGWMVRLSGTDFVIWERSATPPPNGVRTVVFIHYPSVTGESIRIRGGHDASLVPAHFPNRWVDIVRYNNTLNPDTATLKASDRRLDWGTQAAANGSDGFDSALDWTTNAWQSAWGAVRTYAVHGFGVDPENTFGPHHWKFDVTMAGTAGQWFEFKAFVRNFQNRGVDQWEGNIAQTGTPHRTANHWGRRGYRTVVAFNQSWANFFRLP